MRLLHFSDIHFGVFPRGFSWLLDKRILGTFTQFVRRKPRQDFSVIERLAALARSLKPDIIVCTGDITALGNPAEFAWNLDKLSPLVDLNGAKFIYLPGNHDAYIRKPAVQEACQKAMQTLNSYPELAAPTPFREITVRNVRIGVLDAACPMPYWRSAGTAPAAALARIAKSFAPPRESHECRLLLSHFPVFMPDGRRVAWRRRMDGDSIVRDIFANGQLDLCLCGHIHTPFIFNAPNGATQCCPGSLTLHRQVAVIDIDETTSAISTRFESLSN